MKRGLSFITGPNFNTQLQQHNTADGLAGPRVKKKVKKQKKDPGEIL